MRSRRKVLLYLGIAMFIPFIIYFGLYHYVGQSSEHLQGASVLLIGFIIVLTFTNSIIMGLVVKQIRNIKILFVSLAYASIGGMLVFHLLTFPSHSKDLTNNYFYVFAQLAIMFSSIWIWLSSLSADHKIVKFLAQYKKMVAPIWCILLIFIGITRLIIPPEQLPFIMFNNLNIHILTIVILLSNTWAIYRHLITYMASKFSIQLAIVYSTGWMNTGQLLLILNTPNKLSWWMFHCLMIVSMIIMLSFIMKEFFNEQSLASSLKKLYRADPDHWIEAYITPSVSDLVHQTESKDAYTAGHNYRVTVYALKLGEEMGLSSSQLKSIALAGLVHDVGKLHIPDHILNKPGKLSIEERAIIEKHPIDGYNMCRQVGFMMEELAVIRSHHEKWDGTGYPDQLAGETIPLVARVIAVADVYDALTSSRAYRKALSHELAMDILIKDSGKHFDPNCVESWKRIVEEEADFFKRMMQPYNNQSQVTSKC